MKKITILLCSLLLVISLSACGNTNTDSDGNVNNSGMDNGITSNSNTQNSNSQHSGSSVSSTIDSTLQGAASDMSELVAEITGEDAKKKAFEHAGVKKEDVTDLEIDLDRDGSILKYEIDFRHGNIEYDYDINAITGEIISADKDRK